jgi:hypothetical protein
VPDIDLKTVTPKVLEKADTRIEARKEVKKTLEKRCAPVLGSAFAPAAHLVSSRLSDTSSAERTRLVCSTCTLSCDSKRLNGVERNSLQPFVASRLHRRAAPRCSYFSLQAYGSLWIALAGSRKQRSGCLFTSTATNVFASVSQPDPTLQPLQPSPHYTHAAHIVRLETRAPE